MIPRILHRIWLGSLPMPDEFVTYGEKLRQLHPDWDHRLWTDDNIPELVNQHEFASAPHASWASNILRYELLLRFGGIYLDTDIEPLRPFDDLLGSAAFVAKDCATHICNAVLGSSPCHPLFSQLVGAIPERLARVPNLPSPIAVGSGYLTSTLLQFDNIAPVTWLEPNAFFPVSFPQREILNHPYSFPESYGVHHWARSWSN